ncbi:DUF4118 domain-containing protein [Sphingomonas sp. G124]|uniref:DUF4118 domain-containing protein n=1 Tax=Sphingomonas cremea TaxID=2904799 RepID=A0A9X1QK01_9SPHN|nr:DUF4118 domain-containing protein [Sphingomonas cremea]MCF2515128.1 DUF4118 domain-containing protein [Sphingomonas cremea]
MTLAARLRRWLVLPPITGIRAIGWTLAAIAVPTLGRVAVDGHVTGVGFTPYCPFVLLSAVLLGWRHATVVALAAAVIGDALFVGPRFQLIEAPTDIFGVVVFLGTSCLMIGLVHAMRTLMQNGGRPATAVDGVIFSQERGQAWASWPGASYYIRLGPQDQVAEMMKDYLAQQELAKRLNGGARASQATTPTF